MSRKQLPADLVANFGDRWWRLNNLYWIRDEKGNKIKFKPNHVQTLLYLAFWYLNLILKSRQHGVTTFICILYLDACLFNSNVAAGIIAHTLGDVEEIFDNKIKFAYDNLPEQLKAALPTDKETGKVLKLANGSSIRVGVSLRSGTFQYLHVTEFGKVCAQYPKKAQEIVTGALNTVHVGQYITIESTAEGRSGYFYDYCMTALKKLQEGAQLNKLDFKLHFFGWWQDPRNRLDQEHPPVLTKELQEYFVDLRLKHGIELDDAQIAWYVAKKHTMGDDMFREHPSTPEEAFHAAIHGAYYVQQMAKLRGGKRLGVVAYDPRLPVDTGWDLGMNDTTCIVFRQRFGTENRIIDYLENCGEVLGFYVRELLAKPYVYGTHYLPHDSSVRSLASDEVETREEKLRKLGLRNLVTVERTKNIEDGIDEVRGFLPSCWIDEANCNRLIAALDEYRKAWNEKMGVYASYPLHNWASNPADAFRTLACGVDSYEVVSGANSGNRRSRVRGGMSA